MLDFITKTIAKLVGSKNERDLKELFPYVEKVNAQYVKLRSISDDDLRGMTVSLMGQIDAALAPIDSKMEEFHAKVSVGSDIDDNEKETIFEQIDKLSKERNVQLEKVLLDLLPIAFSVIRETARRLKENGQLVVTATPFDIEYASLHGHVTISDGKATWSNRWMAAGNELVWDMVHYDVQLIGGVVLHQGKISEMATGEGKTLVATLPAYLNALARRGVHIVTVNDYLAKRDSEWMAPLMEFHEIHVDCIDRHQPNTQARRNAYLAHITYGTNNEFGFDYLRDNMARTSQELVQRKHHYAMVDEVDSVLVDDARTPLIISGPMERGDDQEMFHSLKPRVMKLVEEQQKLANGFLNEAKAKIKAGDDSNAGLPLFRAHRGLPKSKPLIKFLSEQGMKQLMQKTESHYLQDNSRNMKEADAPLYFVIDEKNNSIELTQKGLELITKEGEDTSFFILPDIATTLDRVEKDPRLSEHEKLEKKDAILNDYNAKSQRIHTVNQLLKAYAMFEKDVDYVIMDGKVKIVDEQTGRIMEGRRYSDGLHQALEAKENVRIEEATQTYATITLQNYFRMYHKLAGMTGTAETEAGEFWEIYKLDVVVIPTNRSIVRKDEQDLVYKTVREKYNAVVEEIKRLVDLGRPVLVGTTSVENSELLSRMLRMRGVDHQVLNAKQHAREAEIVGNAGASKAVTIATNMAGRGTDIKLSGDAKLSGGLAIIGTERHESRRVDRQLRGRAGRQGDVGSSQFFVSLEDNLMRLFGSDKVMRLMDRWGGMEEGEVIQHSIITDSIERAQKKVEENNFAQRKRLLEYDDVMNSQRKSIYARRHNALDGERLDLDIMDVFYSMALSIVNNTQGDYSGFKLSVFHTFHSETDISNQDFMRLKPEMLAQQVYDMAHAQYKQKSKQMLEEVIIPTVSTIYDEGPEIAHEIMIRVPFTDGARMLLIPINIKQAHDSQCKGIVRAMEQAIALSIIDHNWKEHLRNMDDLRQQVQHASYEQKDPLLIYKFEAFKMFDAFLNNLNTVMVEFLVKVHVVPENPENIRRAMQQEVQRRTAAQNPPPPKVVAQKAEAVGVNDGVNKGVAQLAQQLPPESKKIERTVTPIRSTKVFSRNDKVSVRYIDGSVKRDVKYKSVEQDIADNRCVVIEG